jgi:glutamine amidotransferase
MISVLNYGAGNANSVVRMIERAGGASTLVETPEALSQATKLIVPGVGAFDQCLSQLHERGLAPVLNELALERKIPLLGICMGMQMMCHTSEEGVLPGLGWFDAEVKRFTAEETGGRQIPHMGWNSVALVGDSRLLGAQSELSQRFYFVHSYRVTCHERADVIAETSYGRDFVCAFQRDNIVGVQFHPEKSHRFGLSLIKRFVEL